MSHRPSSGQSEDCDKSGLTDVEILHCEDCIISFCDNPTLDQHFSKKKTVSK